MIASLPMYDTAHTAAANDRFWQVIRAAYGHGPKNLDRTRDLHATWTDPSLVLSQTCGLPYRSRLHREVQLVGTPDYGLPDCPAGHYYSYLVVAEGDARADIAAFATAKLARNEAGSQSGWAAFLDHLKRAGLKFAGDVIDTGSHAASLAAVASGTAEIAAIDALTWTLLARDGGMPSGVRILCHTRPTPGLPYICGPAQDATRLADAIQQAIAHLSPQDRATLHLNALVQIPAQDYLSVPLP